MAVDLREVLEESRAPRRREGGPGRAAEILSVCSCLTEEKGVEDVLQALELLRRHAPEARWRYTVIGPDPVAGEPHLRQLQALSRGLNLGDAVRFLGFVPHAQIAGHLRSADIFVDARRVGNFSSVILEALAAGSAVVGSDVEGNTEFLKDEVNGLLFAQGDSSSLARCLERLVNRPEQVARLEAAAAEWFEQNGELYQFPSHVRVLERVYGAALSASKEGFGKTP
jgi:glycosyltransferase involved in cell wall biosynthesis